MKHTLHLSYQFTFICTFFGLTIIGCKTVQAETENIGDIEVSAAHHETASRTSSKPVTMIGRETIKASHVQNIVDLLKGQANIVVRDSSGTGAKSQVDLGGFGEASAANLVVLIDGRRVNSPDLSGVDWTQIPVDQIERIEITHGASSVLYGDGAVGGAINIVSRIPESGGVLSVNGGSFGTFSGLGRIGADAGKARVEANFSGLSTDGYRDNSTFERFDGGLRAEADLSANFSFRINGNHHQDRSGLPGLLTADQMAVNRKQSGSPRDFSRTKDSFVDSGLNWMSDFGLELDLAGGMRKRDVHSEFVDFGSKSDFVQRIRSFRPKLSLNPGTDLPVRITAGADIDRGDGSFDFGGAAATTQFDRNRTGYYGLIQAGPEDQWWNISGGVRSEKVEDTFSQLDIKSVSHSSTAWEAGASLGLIENLRLRFNVARSLRFPLLDERFNFFTGAVDTGLLPQTGRHYSTALRYNLDKAWAEIAVSRADLDQEIFYNPLTFANENYSDKTRHDVITLAVFWDAHDWLQLSGNYTYALTKFRGGSFDGKNIPAVPKNRLGGSWKARWNKALSTVLKLNYVGESFLISDQPNIRPPLSSYFVVDAVASYRWQETEVFVRLDNLTNRKYSSYGVFSPGFPPFSPPSDNFFPSPGISFRTGVSYSF